MKLMALLFACTMVMGWIPAMAGDNADSAELSDSINQEKENDLEADDTAMEIHDVEAEQKLAREQARAQEQMKAAAQKRLHQIQAQKDSISDKIRLDIMISENRRKQAEAETAVLKKQIAAVQANIKALQNSKLKAEKSAADARAIAQAGREAIRDLQIKQAALSEQNKKAQADNRKAQLELAALKRQSAQLRGTNTADAKP